MIRYLEHKDIDKKLWDACIHASGNEMLYAYSWFLDIVSPGWNALVYDNYSTVMPLPWRKKMGVRYIYQPFFTQQLGVFGEDTDRRVTQFLASVPSEYRFIDIYLNEQNILPDKSHIQEERRTQFLDFSLTYKELYKRYDPKLRRNLRRASECGLEAREVSPEVIVKMFRETQGRLKMFRNKDYNTLLRLLSVVHEKGISDNIGIYTANGELCASASFINIGNRVMYFKSTTYEFGRKLRAMHWLLDNYIQQKAGSGKIFDFGGSVIPSVESFFKSFGAEDHIYLHIRINRLPWYIRWLKN